MLGPGKKWSAKKLVKKSRGTLFLIIANNLLYELCLLQNDPQLGMSMQKILQKSCFRATLL
jgi:hypothetical protein